MKVRYDPEADALYVGLADASVTESEEVRAGIVLDLDAGGRVVAIEILDAKEHLSAGAKLAQLTPPERSLRAPPAPDPVRWP